MGSKRAINLLRKGLRPTMTNVGVGLCAIEAVTADKTLVEGDSGKTFLVNPAAETTITLPSTLISGWHCTVIVTEDIAATDGSMDQIVNIDLGSGTNLANIGQVHEVDGAAGNFAVANDYFFVFNECRWWWL